MQNGGYFFFFWGGGGGGGLLKFQKFQKNNRWKLMANPDSDEAS